MSNENLNVNDPMVQITGFLNHHIVDGKYVPNAVFTPSYSLRSISLKDGKVIEPIKLEGEQHEATTYQEIDPKDENYRTYFVLVSTERAAFSLSNGEVHPLEIHSVIKALNETGDDNAEYYQHFITAVGSNRAKFKEPSDMEMYYQNRSNFKKLLGDSNPSVLTFLSEVLDFNNSGVPSWENCKSVESGTKKSYTWGLNIQTIDGKFTDNEETVLFVWKKFQDEEGKTQPVTHLLVRRLPDEGRVSLMENTLVEFDVNENLIFGETAEAVLSVTYDINNHIVIEHEILKVDGFDISSVLPLQNNQ